MRLTSKCCNSLIERGCSWELNLRMRSPERVQIHIYMRHWQGVMQLHSCHLHLVALNHSSNRSPHDVRHFCRRKRWSSRITVWRGWTRSMAADWGAHEQDDLPMFCNAPYDLSEGHELIARTDCLHNIWSFALTTKSESSFCSWCGCRAVDQMPTLRAPPLGPKRTQKTTEKRVKLQCELCCSVLSSEARQLKGPKRSLKVYHSGRAFYKIVPWSRSYCN